MRVLVACEFSGRVREAFRKLGHDAWSLDILPADDGSKYHLQMHLECAALNKTHWDMLIAFPPCTHLAVSGARWFKDKHKEQQEAIAFFLKIANCDIEKIAIENPIGIMSSHYRKPDQIIQPWQFGHGETKATCLWLKDLPPLRPTNIVEGREGRVWKEPPSPDRWKKRSITYQGIADAMAEQWGTSDITTLDIPSYEVIKSATPVHLVTAAHAMHKYDITRIRENKAFTFLAAAKACAEAWGLDYV